MGAILGVLCVKVQVGQMVRVDMCTHMWEWEGRYCDQGHNKDRRIEWFIPIFCTSIITLYLHLQKFMKFYAKNTPHVPAPGNNTVLNKVNVNLVLVPLVLEIVESSLSRQGLDCPSRHDGRNG